MLFHGVLNYNDPSEALVFRYDAFLPGVNKHAALRRTRVKHPKLPPWFNYNDIIQAMAHRDERKRDKLFDLYKKPRNKVSTLVHTAKENYFNKLITDNGDTARIWLAVNEITRKSSPQSNNSASNITPDSFYKHLLS